MKNNTSMNSEGYDNFSVEALELKAAEESIDLKSDSIIREEYLYQKKQERFKKTAFGVQTIVSRKLYRAANLTVEEYFRKKWNISRAQVYRFLDAADVLRQLKDFSFTPRHELLCRTLKHYAKTNEHMVLLWQSVLDKAQNKLTSINSGLITKVWNELVSEGKIVPKVQEKGSRRVRTYKKKTTLPIPSYSSTSAISSTALTEIENSIKNINNISENSKRKVNSKRNHSTSKVHKEKESKLFSRRINKSLASDLELSESLLGRNIFTSSQPNTAIHGNSNPPYNYNEMPSTSNNVKIEPPTPPPEYIYNHRNSASWNCPPPLNNNNNNNNGGNNMNYPNNNNNNINNTNNGNPIPMQNFSNNTNNNNINNNNNNFNRNNYPNVNNNPPLNYNNIMNNNNNPNNNGNYPPNQNMNFVNNPNYYPNNNNNNNNNNGNNKNNNFNNGMPMMNSPQNYNYPPVKQEPMNNYYPNNNNNNEPNTK